MQERDMSQKYLTNMSSHITALLGHSLQDPNTCLLTCARIDLGVIPRQQGGMMYCLMAVVWGCGIDLYASVDPENAMVYVDTVLETVVKSAIAYGRS